MAENTGLGVTHFYRRRYPRIDLTLPVEYSLDPAKDASASQLTKTGTIGGGGLMLYLKRAVDKGSVMRLALYLPDKVIIFCVVKVVWTELLSGEERDDFKTGVEFQEISENDLQRLRSFIKNHQNPVLLPPSLQSGDE